MARRLADYAGTARKLINELGDKPVKISAPELATLTGEPLGRVTRVLHIMQRAGALRLDMTYAGKEGTKATYAVLGTLEETEQRMKERGLHWSQFQEEKAARMGLPEAKAQPARSLTALAPLRKSEPRAEIEVARRYRDQGMFIAAQRKQFEEMGLQLPEISSDLVPDRRLELEAIVRTLPYIETLEKSNERLEEQNRTIRQPFNELRDVRAERDRLKEQVERLVAEKLAIRDDVQQVMDRHRGEVKGFKDRIAQLEAEANRIRGNTHRDEINKIPARS